MDLIVWKALILIPLAFVWGFFCESTGRLLTGEKRDKNPDQSQDL